MKQVSNSPPRHHLELSSHLILWCSLLYEASVVEGPVKKHYMSHVKEVCAAILSFHSTKPKPNNSGILTMVFTTILLHTLVQVTFIPGQ